MTNVVNKRFRELGNGVVAEMVAPEIRMKWDPVSGNIQLIYECQEYIYIDGAYVDVQGRRDTLWVDGMEVLPRLFAQPEDLDPVTGAPLEHISGAGVVNMFKLAFDRLANEKGFASESLTSGFNLNSPNVSEEPPPVVDETVTIIEPTTETDKEETP